MGAFVFLLCGTFLTTTVGLGYGLSAERQLMSKAVEDFEGTTRAEFSRQKINASVLYCELLCLRDPDCMSFFHNRITGVCQTHGVVFFNSADGQLSTGSQYYTHLQAACPSDLGYIYNRALDLCYKFHYLNQGDYSHARQMCEYEGADLVVLDTKEKFDHIGLTIKASTFPFNGWFAFYIGATDESYSTQDWHWSDGQQMDQTTLTWCEGEPNSPGSERHIAIVDKPPTGICIVDLDSFKKHFICERQM